MVFRRTCGSYAQLLDCLRTDGFVPLHYSLMWVISRFFKLTPFVLRFVPALSGTLMVPAVYFLARQMLPRGTSLMAAAFAACSAFLLFYSRDAKMYMDSWLFVALNAGCLLWWFRSGKSTAWLCWIATGAAACGLQMQSAIPIAISLLLLFTQHKMRWQQAVLWMVGFIVILSGPIGYFEKFNRWQDQVDPFGRPKTGLEWINDYNRGRTGPELVRFLGTSMMMGWEWPREVDAHDIPSERVTWPARAAVVMLAIFVVACLPWPGIWRSPPKPVLRYCEEADIEPKEYPALRRTSWVDIEPQWRIALWLSFWIALPVYGFYCWSMPGFAAPLDGWKWFVDEYPGVLLAAHEPWVWCVLGALFFGLCGLLIRYRQIRPMVARALALLAVLALMIGLFQLTAVVIDSISKSAIAAGKPIQSLWVPRYMGFITPMLCVAAAAMLMRLPSRWFRTVAIVFLLGLNLGVASFRIIGQTEPPVDLMASDAFAAQDISSHALFWTHLKASRENPGGENIYGEPGQYYLQLLEDKPTDPIQFMTAMKQRPSHGLRVMPWDRGIPPDIDRIILWSQYDSNGLSQIPDPNPPAGWILKEDRWFIARDCWIWKDLAQYRRSVFVKTER
jgi:hypothetical protein